MIWGEGGRYKKWTSDRNSQSVLSLSLPPTTGSVVKFIAKAPDGIWYPGKAQRMRLSFAEHGQHIPASAGQISRSITTWEMWMHFCRGSSCGPGKCPVSTIRGEDKKCLKKEESGLIFTHVYQINPFHFQGKFWPARLYWWIILFVGVDVRHNDSFLGSPPDIFYEHIFKFSYRNACLCK